MASRLFPLLRWGICASVVQGSVPYVVNSLGTPPFLEDGIDEVLVDILLCRVCAQRVCGVVFD